MDFLVKYLQDPKLNKKVIVAEELKKEIIQTGKLGKYTLKDVKIKGCSIVLLQKRFLCAYQNYVKKHSYIKCYFASVQTECKVGELSV